MKTKKPPQVAKQEAFEETGLVGKIVGKRPLGSYYSVEAEESRRSDRSVGLFIPD